VSAAIRNHGPLVVLKLGGSVLRDPSDLSSAVHEVYRHVRRGARVLAVVSAFHGRTDTLARAAAALGADADPSDVARLLAVGEAESAAALVLALDRAGIPADTLEPREVGPTCIGSPVDASPIELDVAAFDAAFTRVPVVVFPGWVGRTVAGRPAVLGRGGSDLTALFAARALGAARCVLLKDVEALYERDPAAPRDHGAPAPRRLVRASWDDALALAEAGAGILQAKAVHFAREHELAFEVAGAGGTTGTRIDAGPTVRSAWEGEARPLRIALAGLGTVGARVHAELAARPDLFEVVSILVRDAARADRPTAAASLVTDDLEAFWSHEADMLVELCGGITPAAGWIAHALAAARDVVTANKAALAAQSGALEQLAARSGRRLLCSAAVGGALPALEAVSRAARRQGATQLVGFEGVLNGTSTFVLDRVHEGACFDDAVRAARAAGYAEADPTLDLDGTDLAQKVELLARAAGWLAGARGVRWVTREGVHTPSTRSAEPTSDDDGPPERLVGTCHMTEVGPLASVVRRRPGARDPLASTRGAGNVLVLHFADGSSEVHRGRGAGAWPTATAVLADLFDLARRHRRSSERPASSAGIARSSSNATAASNEVPR
jgi:homoserine dehydrogenase